ncbi:MAG: AMP-dependent synthetase [Acidimicrobiaceae bacterium]|nr:AMP-dependent synthetase [Acidimicrobiaceae bacterium]
MLVVSDVYTLPDLLARAVNKYPDSDIVVFPDSRTTYSQLFERASKTARSLKALGVDAGDSVGILMSNCLEFVDLLLGSQLIGAVPVPINARYKAKELAYVIDDAQLKVLATTDRIVEHVDFVSLLQESFPELANQDNPMELNLEKAQNLNTIVLFGERMPTGMLDTKTFESFSDQISAEEIEISRSRLQIRDIAMMMYTSGTTANPKGCPITHEALVRPAVEAGRSRFAITETDRMWDPLPMFHMSFVLPLIACIDAGAALLTMEYFEPKLALSYMKSEKATLNFASFPTIMEALLNHEDYDADVLNMRIVNNVGPADLLVSMQERMPNTVQISAYGLTECGGVVSFGHVEDSLENRTQTSGRLFRGIQAQIRHPENDEILGPHVQGEILIKGYCVFEGYHNAPEKNQEAFTEDGWFRTGDLCSLDEEGRVTYHGRIKDMLKVGGENVAAAEIEGFLSHHPAVQLAQVVSAPDKKYVEVPAAFIQLKEGMSATEDEIINFCNGHLSSFKIPRYVRFVSEWPMSATKIQKIRLREQIASEIRE